MRCGGYGERTMHNSQEFARNCLTHSDFAVMLRYWKSRNRMNEAAERRQASTDSRHAERGNLCQRNGAIERRFQADDSQAPGGRWTRSRRLSRRDGCSDLPARAGFRWTKFGRSSARRPRTCPPKNAEHSELVTCTPLRRLIQTQSSCRRGTSGSAISRAPADSCLILVRRMQNRIQLTTDGANFYREAVLEAFGGWVDYAQLIKIYATPQEAEKRYSPSQCVGTETRVLEGNPDPEFISTSLVERQNLTMRMNMRRFTRLTNAFSKKVLHHSSSVALHFFAYNFVRPHGTLTKKPRMASR